MQGLPAWVDWRWSGSAPGGPGPVREEHTQQTGCDTDHRRGCEVVELQIPPPIENGNTHQGRNRCWRPWRRQKPARRSAPGLGLLVRPHKAQVMRATDTRCWSYVRNSQLNRERWQSCCRCSTPLSRVAQPCPLCHTLRSRVSHCMLDPALLHGASVPCAGPQRGVGARATTDAPNNKRAACTDCRGQRGA